MSEKGVLFKKRKNNHGSHHGSSRGSGFPRHNMNKFDGTHLGMRVRLRKDMEKYSECYYNYGYLRSNWIIGLINKYVGKPYNDLIKEFYKKIKRLRDNHKDVGLKDLDWNFEDSYYVDDDGLIHCNSEIKFNRFTNRQLRYNKAQKIPQFGAVAKPRELLRSWELRNYDYPVLLDTNPKLIGNYYCDINGIVLLLPVYHVPEAEDRGYPRWGLSPRPGTYEYKKKKSLEENWIAPTILFNRRETRTNLYRFIHIELQGKMPNPALASLRASIKKAEEDCFNARDSWEESKCKMYLNVLKSRLKFTPEFVSMNVGYGCLYPMVKISDYKKALEKYESEQKKTCNSEG